MLIKDYYRKYKIRPSDSLMVHFKAIYHRYLDLKVSPIFSIEKEMTYGLLMSIPNH